MNPEDQAEEAQEAADSPPAEEIIIDVPTDPPVEDPPVAGSAGSARLPRQIPTIDDQIISGSASIQAALSKYRAEQDRRA